MGGGICSFEFFRGLRDFVSSFRRTPSQFVIPAKPESILIFVVLLSRHPPDFVIPTNAPNFVIPAKAAHFVIPAKAGIQLLAFGSWCVSREPTHVPVFTSRIPARRSLLFACPKRSNQEKGHPGDAPAVAGSLRAAGFR